MIAKNYQDVLDQLIAFGLCGRRIDDGLEFGHMVRCLVSDAGKEKRGWYILHEVTSSAGDVLIFGSYGIWRGDVNNAQKIELRKTEFTDEQRSALRTRLADDRRASEAARKAEAKRAADRATSAWGKCSTQGESDYLTMKGVQGYGVRYSPSGALVIPAMDTAARVHGLQIIRTAKLAEQSKRPRKEFWPPGMAKKGYFHLIGMPTSVVLVAEGYATAASVHAATSGLPTAVAFDAGNLLPVCQALRKRYPGAKIVICADDDAFGERNAGVSAASTAAVAVDGSFVVPVWQDQAARVARHAANGSKWSDFNDLAQTDGIAVVTRQLQAHLGSIRWRQVDPKNLDYEIGGGGRSKLRPIESADHLLKRFSLIYGHGGAVFDHSEHRMLTVSDMRDLCASRYASKAWSESPDRDIVRPEDVGFDPSGADPDTTCNLWSGWPTEPVKGSCDRLLDLLRYMCSGDHDPERLYQWVLRWVAMPIQRPGAKMKTTIVIHGRQGAGKNMFFEAVMAIYGRYGRMIDQNAIEDKFNDWASGKLFLVADEVVARSDVYHVKNKLKSMITGTWIRINPKNMAAYDEKNHANMVFLSNENMPSVLEEDDRRHCVIWTPNKKEKEYYKAIVAEIENGGIAALHDYLLNLDLGEFTASTEPPATDARAELIDISRDNTSKFLEWIISGDFGSEIKAPALTQDVYDCYKLWCVRTGNKATSIQRLQNAWLRRNDIQRERKRYMGITGGQIGPHWMFMFGTENKPIDRPESSWIGNGVADFQAAMADYKGTI